MRLASRRVPARAAVLLGAGLLLLGACTPAEDPGARGAGEAAEGAGGISPDSAAARVARGLLRAVRFAGEPPETFSLEERMVRYRVPAVSVAVMDDGRVAWARAWGTADVATGAPAAPETLFQAASISKPVAALAALSLVEEGQLELDAPVGTYLSGWRIPENDFTADSAVTLRGLLTHSAGTTVWGFPGYRKDRPFAEGQVVASNAQVLEGEGNTDPVRVFRVPGTGWQYSGGGYTVMEQMVEDVTGRPFHEVARKRVLVPAGMERSTFAQPLPEARWYEAARGHRGDGREVEGEWHTYPEQAAAGLWTTPTELLRLSEHLLGILDGSVEDGILSREMLEAALTPHHGGEERYRGWGLGFGLEGEGDPATFGHGGSNEGFKAQWTVFRNRGQGIAVMTNGDRGSALAREVMRAAAAVYGWPGLEPEERRRAERSAASLRELEGTYRLVDGPGLTVTVRAVEGALELHVPDRGTSTIHPDADTPGEFFDPDDASVLRFVRDEGGAVVAVEDETGNRFERVP